MSQTAGEVANALMTAMQAGDIEAVLALFDADCVVVEAASLPYGGEYKGRQGLRNLIESFSSLFELKIRNYEITSGDAYAFMRADCTFTFHNSGRSLDLPVVEVYTVRDGLVVRCEVFYMDTAAINQAAGAA